MYALFKSILLNTSNTQSATEIKNNRQSLSYVRKYVKHNKIRFKKYNLNSISFFNFENNFNSNHPNVFNFKQRN